MSVFHCQIVFAQNFAPVLLKKKKKLNIVFFTRNFTTEPCSSFVITMYLYLYYLIKYMTSNTVSTD